MPYPQLLTTIIVLFLLSCNGATDVKSSSSNKDNSPTEQKKNSKSCLEKYAMKPSTILDLKTVASLANVEESALEVIPEDEKLSARVCKYTWSTGRKSKFKVGPDFMELEVSNDIVVGLFRILDAEKSGLKPPYSEWFKNSHRQLTQEEVVNLRKSVNKDLEKNDELNSDIGMQLLDGIIDLGKKDVYIDVEGLGDLASAKISGISPDIYLDILHKNLTFRVVVNVSNNKNENFELAKKIGAEIISLCD